MAGVGSILLCEGSQEVTASCESCDVRIFAGSARFASVGHVAMETNV